LRIKCSR